ncbi:MAG TPA: polyketide cyclase / dehydrase and lipid transport [Mycobacteriales bacterium]|nr:polyketide cyclase / dehydrase and lipid transport [Mycobacteriales bacterium]
MPMVDLIDETFIVAAPADVAVALHDEALWARLFPGLELTVFMDRGDEGLRFTVTGSLAGSSELWVQPWGDGAIVHYYLRADLTRRGSATEAITGAPRALVRRSIRARTRHVHRVKAGMNALKDSLESGRAAGLGRTG